MDDPLWAIRRELSVELFLYPSDFLTWPDEEQKNLHTAVLRRLELEQALAHEPRAVERRRRQLTRIENHMRNAPAAS
jgi:hypothetical protein